MTLKWSRLTLWPKGFALRKELIESAPMEPPASAPPCVLFDNGSLRPEATLNLRLIGLRLQARIGTEVRAVSLLHSSGIAPRELGGMPAQILEPALEAMLAAGRSRAVLLPLFVGPSRALTDYVPERLACLARRHPEARLALGRPLVDVAAPDDTRIAGIMADEVRAVIRQRGLVRPKVVLVDHGSPVRAVVAVRDLVGRQLRKLLTGEVARVTAASMERRPGPAYDFADPLLATLLRRRGFSGEVVVAPLFLSPGRHAGPDGDVARICAAAEQVQAGLRTHLAALVGEDSRLIEVLADRYAEARGRL
jgi:sirohydrochlorin ferrochelatase